MRLQIERFRLNRRALQLEPESEAVSVSIAIFLAMQEEVKRHAKEFIVVMLPTHRDFTRFHNASEHRKNWNTIKAMIQQKRIHTIDLLPDMEKLPKNQFDKGHDGSHYGPNANKIIAKLIGNYLISNNILTKLR